MHEHPVGTTPQQRQSRHLQAHSSTSTMSKECEPGATPGRLTNARQSHSACKHQPVCCGTMPCWGFLENQSSWLKRTRQHRASKNCGIPSLLCFLAHLLGVDSQHHHPPTTGRLSKRAMAFELKSEANLLCPHTTALYTLAAIPSSTARHVAALRTSPLTPQAMLPRVSSEDAPDAKASTSIFTQ